MRIRVKFPLTICLQDIVPVLTVCVDETPLHGNVLASGDDKADREAEEATARRLNGGDVWAWAHVTVSVSVLGFTGTDRLGCCSYDNEHAFRTDGYFQDMLANANADLLQQLKNAGFELTE